MLHLHARCAAGLVERRPSLAPSIGSRSGANAVAVRTPGVGQGVPCSKQLAKVAGRSRKQSSGYSSKRAMALRAEAEGSQAVADIEDVVHASGPRVGVILVDHGSRRAESNKVLENFVSTYMEVTGRDLVEPAHMELAEPSISVAYGRCLGRGAERVIISPYFLSPGRHWQRDIPALAAEAAAQHNHSDYVVTAPLGPHKLLAAILEERIQHCLEHMDGKRGPCEMCSESGNCMMKAELELEK